ncbi:MAG: hypothetical protein ACYCU3_16400, partial [Streptosporangiaceae bacterium]
MTGFGVLLAAGIAALVLAGVADLVIGAGRQRARAVPYLIGAAAAACLTMAGGGALAGQPARLPV